MIANSQDSTFGAVKARRLILSTNHETPLVISDVFSLDNEGNISCNEMECKSMNITSGTVTDVLTIDTTNTAALKVRKDASGGDVLTVNTQDSKVVMNADLDVNGVITSVEAKSIATEDVIIQLAKSNGLISDTYDQGLFGEYKFGSGTRYWSLYRDASDSGIFKLENAIATLPTTTIASGTPATLQIGELKIGSQTLNDLQYVTLINQGLATTSSPTFNTVTAALVGNATTATTAGSTNTFTGSSLPAITTIGLTSNIPQSAYDRLKTMQDVSSGANVTFGTVTGNLTGNCSGSATTVTGATQAAITTLPNLGLVAGTAINSTRWGYLGALNQSLTTSSSPTFNTVTGSSSSNTAQMQAQQTDVTGFARISLGCGTTNWVNAAGGQSSGLPGCYTFFNGADRMILNSSGNLTIGSSNLAANTYKLYADGAGYFTTSLQCNGFRSSSNAGFTQNGTFNSHTDGYAYGIIASGTFQPTQNATELRSVSSQSFFHPNGFTTGAVSSLFAAVGLSGSSGTINNAYGLYVSPGSSTPAGVTVTNAYGAYLNTPSHGSNRWALFTNGNSRFTGNATFIGGVDIISNVVIEGNVNLTALTNSTQANLQINLTTGALSRPTSSMRYKENIVESKVDTSNIYSTVAKEFDYKKECGGGHDVGYIAEDLHALGLNALVNYDGQGRPDSIKYDKLSFYLLEELKKLKTRIEVLIVDGNRVS